MTALDRGDAVLYDRRPYVYDRSIAVETIVIDGRAGQATNAGAVWGDMDRDPSGVERMVARTEAEK